MWAVSIITSITQRSTLLVLFETYNIAASPAILVVEPDIGARRYAIIQRRRAGAYAGRTLETNIALQIQAVRVPSKPSSTYSLLEGPSTHTGDLLCCGMIRSYRCQYWCRYIRLGTAFRY